jgi:hypothetical protein
VAELSPAPDPARMTPSRSDPVSTYDVRSALLTASSTRLPMGSAGSSRNARPLVTALVTPA